MSRTGARILVDQLIVHGVDTVFCVPGESYIAALDALRDAPIRLVVARHEAGAANMAEAYGKLTGRPGICFVTRAPGATHAATGVYTAFQDSTPLILFVGQVPRGHRGREAFQELDYAAAFGSYSKWVDEVQQPLPVGPAGRRQGGLQLLAVQFEAHGRLPGAVPSRGVDRAQSFGRHARA